MQDDVVHSHLSLPLQPPERLRVHVPLRRRGLKYMRMITAIIVVLRYFKSNFGAAKDTRPCLWVEKKSADPNG